MNNNTPKVTVIVTSYNQENYIEKAIKSVFEQSFEDLEVLFADDCSTDNTVNIIQNYINQKPDICRLLNREVNLGICRNMHDAYHQSRGEYIAILEGDDYWTDSNRISKMVKILDCNPKYPGIFNAIKLEQDNKFLDFKGQKKIFQNKNGELDIESLIQDNVIGNLSCCIFRAKELKKIKKEVFENYFIVDWFTAMILIDSNGPLYFLNEYLSVYRLHNNSEWSGMCIEKKRYKYIECIVLYNRYFEYKYDELFMKVLSQRFKLNFYKIIQAIVLLFFRIISFENILHLINVTRHKNNLIKTKIVEFIKKIY